MVQLNDATKVGHLLLFTNTKIFRRRSELLIHYYNESNKTFNTAVLLQAFFI